MATSWERKRLRIPQLFVFRRLSLFTSKVLVGLVLFFLSTPRISASPQINGDDQSPVLQKLEIKVLAGSPPVPVAHARV
ncbi:hypothetical protein A6X21_12405 [Planctopirus hydrillae]|uniref:Uncharacterized protein n=1 Tax=Planctopirus hydrillae TaxID=1841610 RepID=A0A1C3E5J0_9PLAN|nr:hypothetical protein A6X21_12405 [Planctopirus hydrillae]